jgi:hypothetical protein
MANITAPYGTYRNAAGIVVPKGKPPPGAPKDPNADPNHNPYPNDPQARFVNGQWIDVPVKPVKKTAAQVAAAKGNTEYQKWLASKKKGNQNPGYTFDPLAGMPGNTELTPFPNFDASTLPDGSDTPYVPGHAFKQGKAGILDPKAYAHLVGSDSFKPIIDALTGQQSRLKGGIGDANSMIDKSYGQAADSSLRGAQVVKDSNAQANQGLTDLAARMAQAAGGDPTAAAAVGQAVGNQQEANTRFANIDSEAQAAVAAAANRDAGTSKLEYKGATDQAISDLAEKIGQARTQGQQAQGGAIKDALGFNSDQQTAQTSRDVAKQEAWLAGQLAGPQIEAGRLANIGTRQTLDINKNTVAVGNWQALNTAQQNKDVANWTAFGNKNLAQQVKMAMNKGNSNPIFDALTDPTGAGAAIEKDVIGSMLTKSGPGVDPGSMYSGAIKTMHKQYPDAPSSAIKILAAQFVSKQMPIWNSQHKKGQDNSGKTWKFVNGAPALVKA